MILTPIQQEMLQGKVCPYCSSSSEYIDSSEIYSNGMSYGMVYACRKCNAWVGVHKSRPLEALGRLANAELREAKKEAHEYFDKLWKLNLMDRKDAYKWLSERLEIDREYCHIGMFSVKTCQSVVFYSKQFLNDNRRFDLDFGKEPVTPYYEL